MSNLCENVRKEKFEMISDKKRKLYKKALEKWGIKPQLLMIIEECCELSVKVAHLSRNRKDIKPEDLCDEIADVEIMLEQLKLIYNLEEKTEKMKQFKFNRLEKRLA